LDLISVKLTPFINIHIVDFYQARISHPINIHIVDSIGAETDWLNLCVSYPMTYLPWPKSFGMVQLELGFGVGLGWLELCSLQFLVLYLGDLAIVEIPNISESKERNRAEPEYIRGRI